MFMARKTAFEETHVQTVNELNRLDKPFFTWLFPSHKNPMSIPVTTAKARLGDGT